MVKQVYQAWQTAIGAFGTTKLAVLVSGAALVVVVSYHWRQGGSKAVMKYLLPDVCIVLAVFFLAWLGVGIYYFFRPIPRLQAIIYQWPYDPSIAVEVRPLGNEVWIKPTILIPASERNIDEEVLFGDMYGNPMSTTGPFPEETRDGWAIIHCDQTVIYQHSSLYFVVKKLPKRFGILPEGERFPIEYIYKPEKQAYVPLR